MVQITPRRWVAAAGALGLAALVLTLPACTSEGNGNFTLLGYTTVPNYRTDIKTVRVPIFKNRTYIQGLEFSLTQAICQAIGQYTPYRVVNGDGPADTELTGTIVSVVKLNPLNGPTNEGLQLELDVTVEVTWKDLRTGETLSRPGRRPGEPPRPEGPVPPLLAEPTPVQPLPDIPGVPGVPAPPTLPGTPAMAAAGTPPPGPQEKIPPVTIKSTVTYVPELGASTASARAKSCWQLAVDIVSLMEKPW